MWFLLTGCVDDLSSCMILTTRLGSGSGCEVIMFVVLLATLLLLETLILFCASLGTSKDCWTGAIGLPFTEFILEEFALSMEGSLLPLYPVKYMQTAANV